MCFSMNPEFTSGFVKVLGYNLYYRHTAKSAPKGILLCLHGGPGATHDYLLPLADMAEYGYKVVFYDQLGCGKSDVPKNPALFTVERGVEEVEGFRKEMKLGKGIHLMGSSYGGLLAIAYAIKYQRNLKSLITTGGIASVPLTITEMEKMKSNLPLDVLSTIKKYEDVGDYQNPEYTRVIQVFYKKHLCRLQEWPKELIYTFNHISQPVYSTMNGPNEFTIIGNIRYWDVTDKLRKISVPTLVTCGRYDEVSPKVARAIHKGIKHSKLVIFPNSSHLPMWEEREKYILVLRAFLDSLKREEKRKKV
jgi:proline iminopeptidase